MAEINKRKLEKMIKEECGRMPTYKEWIEDRREWIRKEGLHPVADRYILKSMYDAEMKEYILICAQLSEKMMEKERLEKELEELRKYVEK